jgi:hypothetical protein
MAPDWQHDGCSLATRWIQFGNMMILDGQHDTIRWAKIIAATWQFGNMMISDGQHDGIR